MMRAPLIEARNRKGPSTYYAQNAISSIFFSVLRSARLALPKRAALTWFPVTVRCAVWAG
jgi:hypothetical protein